MCNKYNILNENFGILSDEENGRGGGGEEKVGRGSSPKADRHIDTLMERANLLQTHSLSGFHK